MKKEEVAALELKLKELAALRDDTVGQIGNLVPDDVPVSDDEDNNAVVDTNGTFEREGWMLSHCDLSVDPSALFLFSPPSRCA